VSSTARPEGVPSAVSRLGLSSGQIVQELGWDDDVDDVLRAAIEDTIGTELVEEAMEPVDVVLLWWRADDGDLIDGLVDAITDLAESGYLWLLTPKVGRSGFVDASDINEGAITAGLSLTHTVPVSQDWTASKMVPPRGSRH
jgi:hypothetical protein